MSLSTRSYFDLIAPHVPPTLISPGHAERIGGVAEHLAPSSNFGFECHLGRAGADADFLVAVLESDGSRGAWTGDNALAEVLETPAGSTAWDVAREFLADWNRDPALAVIRDSWLEFDLAEGSTGLPEPSLFFGFDPEEPKNYPELSIELIERLRRQPMAASQRALVARCFEVLPPGAVIFQVGLLLARRIDDVRLCLRGLTPAAIVDYLAAIDWPGDRDVIRRAMAELAPHTDAIHLDLSVSTQIAPVIGLECVVSDGPRAKAKAQGFLDYLQRLGLSRNDKAAAIFGWLGYSTEAEAPDRWPAHLLKASQSLGPEIMSAFARTLNHIKIGYGADGAFAAKAYLGVRHFWARRPSEASV